MARALIRGGDPILSGQSKQVEVKLQHRYRSSSSFNREDGS